MFSFIFRLVFCMLLSATLLFAQFSVKNSADQTLLEIGIDGNSHFSNNVGIRVQTMEYALAVGGNAVKAGGGTWATLSDGRYKNILGPYEMGLDVIDRLQVVRFQYTPENPFNADPDRPSVGVVAQELAQILPEAVEPTVDGVLMVDSNTVFWAMVNAIKELKREVEELKRQQD